MRGKVINTSPSASVKQRGTRRYGYDVLRVLCAVAVCVFHFEGEMVPSVSSALGGGGLPALAGVTLDILGTGLNAGSLSVCLFFMLSGALASRTLRDESFSTLDYYGHRALRLLPPLWISWFLVCVYYLACGWARFNVPASHFVLTLLGLDGYLQSTMGMSTFYLVGEWFYGAIILVTLVWPALRAVYRSWGPWVALALTLACEGITALIYLPSGFGFWRTIPVCLCSYSLGALVSNARLDCRGHLVVPLSLFAVGLGGGIRMLPTEFRYQLIALGIFTLVELREQMVSQFRGSGVSRFDRAGRVLVWLSGLTLYFFMFQHVVEHWLVTTVSPFIEVTFGTFDYWGLVALALGITAVAAMLAAALEKQISRAIS